MAKVTKTNPNNCQLCAGKFEGVFFDCKIPAHGLWGNICEKCFVAQNCKLGTGKGQKYKIVNDLEAVKTDG